MARPRLWPTLHLAALRCLDPTCSAAFQALLTGLPNPGAEARRIVATLIGET